MLENAGKLLRATCRMCRLPVRLCICENIKPLPTRTSVSLIVQWSEYWRLSNTGRLVQMSLPCSETLIRGKPGEERRVATMKSSAIVLFPGPGVPVLEREALPVWLVVPDGTWREASKIVRHTPSLRGLRRAQLPPGLMSRYGLRKAPRPGTVSTVESVAYALEILGDAAAASGLFQLFDRFVSRLSAGRPAIRKRGQGDTLVDIANANC